MAVANPHKAIPRWLTALGHFWPKNLARIASLLFAGLGLGLGLATYFILNDLTPIKPTPEIVWPLLSLNIFIVTGLLVLIGWQLVALRRARLQNRAGARLHIRLVSLFALIAAIPALMVAVFATVTLDRGLDGWFSDRTKSIIGNSTSVANAYLSEHRASLRRDVGIMATDLNRAAAVWKNNPARFMDFLRAQATVRSLPQALLIQRDGTVIAAASEDRAILSTMPPNQAFDAADSDRPVILTVGSMAQVQGLVRLPAFDGLYLYATRIVDAEVMQHLARAEQAVQEYNSMESRRYEAQVTFALVYVVLTLVILLSAIWLGMALADRLVSPIGRLIWATNRLGQGDMKTRIDASTVGDDEIGQLAHTFNTMVGRIGDQQAELLAARDDLDARASFTERVLGGVSSGVVGVDGDGLIDHVNDVACALFNTSADAVLGKPLGAVMPDLVPLSKKARGNQKKRQPRQVSITDHDGNQHTLLAAAVYAGADSQAGLVITFDDLTDLLAAQRNSAWSDIARRIAHEIKNPLTPIQLSAERIKRKYDTTATRDDDVVEQCVDTIIRQVEDIGRMVDEFASFARMPKAVLKDFDIADIVSRAVFLQRVANPDMDFRFSHPGAVTLFGDPRQLSQAMTNGLKNAVESVSGAAASDDHHIDVTIDLDADELRIGIHDTGPGWPQANRYSLLEPYNTSRSEGTGLGLSIVKKVMEDHGGTLLLEDAPWCAAGGTGASLILAFPLHHDKTVEPSKLHEDV